uniref:Menorin-like domain-containing protein n=1 Tax=Timema bartmani TaxID=61472 RepID=A0A7R9I6J2_9NEOP|nr:unnamed protein product [Timema bartmani]
MNIASCKVLPRVQEFFPRIKNDLTKVTWANDRWRDGVEEILKKEGMPNIQQLREVGAITEILYWKRKLVRLTVPSFRKLTFPLWLNGNTKYMEDKDVDEFLSLCTHNFPEATISIGFNRMGYKPPQKPEKYDAELITKMKETLTRNNVTQTVAFPVDIRRAALSLDTLPALKDVPGITDSALYMYGGLTGADDYLDVVSKIRSLINDFGKDRVYLNLHPNLVKDLI